jgi:hypothetical protein
MTRSRSISSIRRSSVRPSRAGAPCLARDVGRPRIGRTRRRERARHGGGTEGSNPSPSSGESRANLSSSECRRDGRPRHGLRDPYEEDARADRGDEGDQRELALQTPRLSATPACPGGQTGTSHARAAPSLVRALRDARGTGLSSRWLALKRGERDLPRR